MGRMSSPQDAWISLAIVALFAIVCVLRLSFPTASRRAELAALAVTALVFFGLYIRLAKPGL